MYKFILFLMVSSVSATLEDLSSCCDSKACAFPFNGYAYVTTPPRSFTEARHFCQGLGGDLATFGMRSLSTRQSILANLEVKTDVWIGLEDINREGCFQWIDGYDGKECATTDTVYWAPTQPDNEANEDCVELSYNAWSSWYANDDQCSIILPGICEFVLPQCSTAACRDYSA